MVQNYRDSRHAWRPALEAAAPSESRNHKCRNGVFLEFDPPRCIPPWLQDGLRFSPNQIQSKPTGPQYDDKVNNCTELRPLALTEA
jgi:hypothetical protein